MCCTGSLEIQNAKMIQKIAVSSPSHNFVELFSELRHISTIGKNLLSSNTSSTCSRNILNFGPLTAEIHSGVWGIPVNFNGFRVLAALLHGTLWESAKLCVVEQRVSPIFGRAAVTLGIGQHSSFALLSILWYLKSYLV